MTELLRRIEEIVAPTVVGMGFELVRVAMSKGGGTLQVMIEPADGGAAHRRVQGQARDDRRVD